MSFLEKLFATGSASKLISSAFADVEAMISHAGRMLDLALAELLDNEELLEDLDRLDDEIDHRERMVRRSVLEHLSVRPGQDLVASLVLVSIVQDCERIGDFARGLSEITALARHQRSGEYRDRLDDTAQRLRPLFQKTSKAFLADDRALATEVVHSAAALKGELIQLVEDVAASDLSADMAVVYSASARILRRVSAHLSNVASTVVQPYDLMRHDDEEA